VLRRVKTGANDDIRMMWMWHNSSCQLRGETTFPSGSLDVDNFNPLNQTAKCDADAFPISSLGPRPQRFLSDDGRPANLCKIFRGNQPGYFEA